MGSRQGAAQTTIEQVILPVIFLDDDQLQAYEDDQVDVVNAADYSQIQGDPDLIAEFHVLARPGVYYLGMNTALTPTNVVTVRKALASAVDRSDLVTNVLQMPWREAATSVIPSGTLGYQNGAVGHTFNPTQAQTYLTQSGYPGGAGFPAIELWSNYGNEGIVGAVADYWRTHLGITVTTVYTNWDQYLDLMDACGDDPGACSYNTYRMGWVLDYNDPDNILNTLFHPDSAYQYTGWDNARYRDLISMALTETNELSRTDYFQEADQILVEDEAVILPLFFYDRTVLVKSDVLFEYPPLGSPHFMNWRFTTIATKTITSTGGTIDSPDGDVNVVIPGNAVSDTAAVTYTAFFLPPFPPTSTFGFARVGFVMEMTDLGSGEAITSFTGHPLTITIDYTAGDVEGLDEETLELMYWDGSSWSTDGITLVEHDTVNRRLVATITHLTEFGLFGKQRRIVYLPLISRDG